MKATLRQVLLQSRNKLQLEQVHRYSQKIAEEIISSSYFRNAKIIHCYKNMEFEVQTDSIIMQALKNEKRVFAPIIISKTNRILFHREIRLIQELAYIRSIRKTIVKSNDINTDTLQELFTPDDLIVVPLLGFDENCNRLGSGFGYYDRFLANMKCRKIGLAFEVQKIKEVPTEIWDVQLDAIITEERVYTSEK